ncbi:hypothetical protein [Prochlorococcus sp. MIT 1341]|uniref:hypothetical protein n=1 Tax=Prochlorococcus sp. MIT 1341 TaxID=3096221 RepID=UPI002A74CA28|nr:hypothetical protein [Prochlorococcus sp. MIT 1341]
MGDIGKYVSVSVKITRTLLNVLCTVMCLLVLSPAAFAENQAIAGPNQPFAHKNNFGKSTTSIGSMGYHQFLFMDIGAVGSKAPPLNVIEGEITDPNFNVMRNQATKKSTAIAWVVGCLVIATIVPLATWWYFSR